MKPIRVVGILFVSLVMALAAAQKASAQVGGYVFESITVSSGDDPISSGLSGIVDFDKNGNRLVEVAVQQEQAWIIVGKKYKLGGTSGVLAGSVGHFQGAPWAGPYVTADVPFAKGASAGIWLWPGFMPWAPRNWKDTATSPYIGNVGGVTVKIGRLKLAYTSQKFLNDDWNELPGVSYSQPIQKEFTATCSVTRNNNKHEWMFYVGLNWAPDHKNTPVASAP